MIEKLKLHFSVLHEKYCGQTQTSGHSMPKSANIHKHMQGHCGPLNFSLGQNFSYWEIFFQKYKIWGSKFLFRAELGIYEQKNWILSTCDGH